jgi:hypothetical protein
MKTAIKKPFAYLATMLKRLVKPGSAARPIDLSLAKVVIAPGDTLLITCDQRLTKEQVEHIKANFATSLPGTKVALLCGGLRATAVLAQG